MDERVRYLGAIEYLYAICGESIFGFIQCPTCKKKGDKEWCGKYFICATIRGEPDIKAEEEYREK